MTARRGLRLTSGGGGRRKRTELGVSGFSLVGGYYYYRACQKVYSLLAHKVGLAIPMERPSPVEVPQLLVIACYWMWWTLQIMTWQNYFIHPG